MKRFEKFFSKSGRQNFHLENLPLMDSIVGLGLKVTFLYSSCRKNAEDVKLSRVEFGFDNLPESFDGLKMLLITDLHIDAIDRSYEWWAAMPAARHSGRVLRSGAAETHKRQVDLWPN